MNRTDQRRNVRRVACTHLPTKWGLFRAIGFELETYNGSRHVDTAVALVLGELNNDAPLVRIHSQCLTGDVLGSLRCDCGDQLELAMRAIAHEGSGLLIYEHKEGRGIGLMGKLQAYSLQERGLDTIEANHALGFSTDYRDFALPVAILNDLAINRVRLLSNNPLKVRALIDAGIDVRQVSCEVAPNAYSFAYLNAKREKMGHVLSLRGDESIESMKHTRAQELYRDSDSKSALTREQFAFASIEIAIRELRAGRMIVVVDDEDRENEGDLVMAAEMITPEAINFMATYGRGLVCLAITGKRVDELNLAPMAPDDTALQSTAFTVSIDAKGRGVTTGISARDRAQTILAAIDASSGPEDLARPGHVFPLRCRAGGVLERRGHTEAAVDLSRLAGLHDSGVICEILNEDGTMARVPDLVQFCKGHELQMITIADLVQYRLKRNYEGLLGRGAIEGQICSAKAAINSRCS
jgi:3,4-dihydroxy-2-butanone 4-phosphate synthase/GTP cyclohydrolase II